MSLGISKRVLGTDQVYVCLSCRLRNASSRNHFSLRLLHAEATQAGGQKSKAPLVESKAGSDNVSNAVIASPQATKLQQVLQRQFAEKRRQNMEKLGLRRTTQVKQNNSRSSVNSRAIEPLIKDKGLILGRKRRSKRLKLSNQAPPSRKAPSLKITVPPPKKNNKAPPEVVSDAQSGKSEKLDPLSTDPFVKLHADVQKLKKALETDDKAKRSSRSKIFKLQTPKDKTKVEARKPNSKSISTSEPPPKKLVRRLTSKHADGKTDNLPTGMQTLKKALVRTVQSSQGEMKASKRPDATPLKLPRTVGSGKDAVIEVINAEALKISAVEVNQPPVPNLSFGLERVLFNPGVYHLQDPRSRVYNFDPYLEKIMPVTEFDFSALKAYVTSSGDEALKRIAQANGKRYVGSSSSMTSVLAHFHFLLSQWREIGTSMLSNTFPKAVSKSFTKIQKAPTAVFLRWRDGNYAIDADKQFANANMLMMLGKSMEKLLTLEKDDFERYRRSNEEAVPAEERNTPESFHYSTMGDFLMRSQLDAHDARLPGTGMFDLKTRAVVSVRMASQQVEKGIGYEIKSRQGEFESYEREYYDMLRSAMLKYSLQVRMGRMDGIFVAYHNTQRIFGFQYISLAEMDAAMHGQWDTTLGDQQFKLSLDLLNKVLDRATKKYPEQSLRIHFETREAQTPFMYIFAEPVTEEQIQEIQSENDAEIAEYERRILGLQEDIGATTRSDEDGKWADLQADVEEEMDKDEVSLSKPEVDQTESGEETRENEAELDDLEVMNKGPLWESARTERGEDESVAVSNDEQDLKDEDQVGLDDVAEGDEADLLGAQPESQKDPGDLADHEIESSVETGDVAAPDMKQLEGMTNTEEELSDEAASMGFLEDQDKVDDVQPLNEADAEIEVGSPKTGPTDTEQQNPASKNEDIASAADDQSGSSQVGAATAAPHSQEVLGMTLTIRNKVNDNYIVRPESLSSKDTWSVEYAMAEVGDKGKAWNLYQASQARRAKVLDHDDDEDDNRNVDWFIRNLRELSKKGQEWRKEQDELDRARPKFVLGQSSPKGELYNVKDTESEG